MAQSFGVPEQDLSLVSAGDDRNLDRRYLLRFLGAGMAALAAPSAVSAAVEPLAEPGSVPCGPPSSLPSHLAILDPCYPNALVPHLYRTGLLGTQGKSSRVAQAIESLVKKNKNYFQKSGFVRELGERVESGNPPKTIQEMFSVFEKAWVASGTPSLLCLKVGRSCVDKGCSNKCFELDYSGGNCLNLGVLADFPGGPCHCVCNPGLLELTIVALIALLLALTPGPDEIVAILAYISRLIVRVAPPIPIPVP